MSIIIVDTRISNLKSLSRAISLVTDEEVLVSRDPAAIGEANHIILPGVGAFGKCMETLTSNGCVMALDEASKNGTPILGICLGMQILASSSSEFGSYEGLGLIAGDVRPLPEETMQGLKIKSTHIGWSRLITRSKHHLLDGVSVDDYFYFVHSYVFNPSDEANILASVELGEKSIPVLVGKNKVFGCQFHPEKSGEAGLKFIAAFLDQ